MILISNLIMNSIMKFHGPTTGRRNENDGDPASPAAWAWLSPAAWRPTRKQEATEPHPKSRFLPAPRQFERFQSTDLQTSPPRTQPLVVIDEPATVTLPE